MKIHPEQRALTLMNQGMITKQEAEQMILQSRKKFDPKSAMRPSKISNPPVAKGQPEPTLYIEISLANGETRLGKVEAISPSRVAITVCNNPDTTDLTRIL